MQRTYALAALAAVPTLLAVTLPRESISFAPREGLVLAKTFESTAEMSLDEMDMLMNGEPMPMEIEMEMTNSISSTIEVVDTYLAVGDGRPTRLLRKFESADSSSEMSASSMMTGEMSATVDATTELVGLGVVYTWDAEAGEYTVAFDEDSDGDEELLEDLAEDMDLRALLPSGDVAVGDSWEIDPESMVDVLSPGGDLKVLPDEDALEEMGGMPAGGPGMNMREMLGDITGDVTGTLDSIREEDGRRLAVIVIEVDIEATNDLTEMVREALEEMEVPMGGQMEIESVDVEMSLAGEGTLLWDLAGGHFVEFNLSAGMDFTMDQAMALSGPQGDMTMEQAMGFTSDTSLVYTAEAL